MSEFDEKVAAFMAKVGLTQEQYDAEYAKESQKYLANGAEVNPAIIFRMIKTRYSSSTKSNAVWYNGFFFGICAPYDKAAEIWEEDIAPRLQYYQNKYGDEWVEHAKKAGEVNDEGKPIWHAGNCEYKWMYGMVIKESDPQRKMLAILTNEAGETKFAVMYVPVSLGFLPVPGQMYKFRAGKAKGTDFWTISPTTVTRLIEDGGFVPYDVAIREINEHCGDRVLSYDEVYDLNSLEVATKSFPSKTRFAITGMMIAGISVIDPSKFDDPKAAINYVDTGDMIGDFDSNVTLRMEQAITFEMANESIGVGVFEPYFSKSKEGDRYPSGNLIGFILNEKLTPIKSVKPNTTVLSSEFD